MSGDPSHSESDIKRAHDMVASTLAAMGRDLMYTPPEVLREMMTVALAQVAREASPPAPSEHSGERRTS